MIDSDVVITRHLGNCNNDIIMIIIIYFFFKVKILYKYISVNNNNNKINSSEWHTASEKEKQMWTKHKNKIFYWNRLNNVTICVVVMNEWKECMKNVLLWMGKK